MGCGPTCRELHRRRPHAARCPLQRARVRDGPLAEVRRGAHQVDVLAQPRVELHSEFHRDGGHRRSAAGSRRVSALCDVGAEGYTATAGALGRKDSASPRNSALEAPTVFGAGKPAAAQPPAAPARHSLRGRTQQPNRRSAAPEDPHSAPAGACQSSVYPSTATSPPGCLRLPPLKMAS